jgi:phosphohistidine swiveling domain-containing protein
MSISDYAASGIADAWDRKQRAREKDLEEWVQDNPQWWAIGLATLGATGMKVAGGFVDVLRIGEGAAEGGVWGVAKDALRVLSVAGPAVKTVGFAASQFINVSKLRIAVQVSEVTGPCTFQAVNNALQLTRGKSLFVTVRDMAAAAGKPLETLKLNEQGKYILATCIDRMVPHLRAAGATVTEVSGLRSVAQVVGLAQRNRVVAFAFETTVRQIKHGQVVMKPIKHSIIAVRTMSGRVRFADYNGKLFNSIEELCGRWGQVVEPIQLWRKGSQGLSGAIVQGTSSFGPIGDKLMAGVAILITGATLIETPDTGVEVAVPVKVVAARPGGADAAPTPIVEASYEAFKQRRRGQPIGRLSPQAVEAGAAMAPPVQMLTGVQFRLNALGFGAGPVDGVLGPRTTRAVRAFQRSYPPLVADGVPGARTQAKLVEICAY